MSADKTVLVTGGAKRIGRGIALSLFQAGYRVAIHYCKLGERSPRNGSPVRRSAVVPSQPRKRGRDPQPCFATSTQRLGSLYGLVNNAARFTRRDPLTMTEADWDFIHSVNLKATFFCCQQGALLMKKAGAGRIVNISSLGGIRPWADHAHYCASKAGVIMLTKALAKAFAPEISVNSVAPGVILSSPDEPRVQDMIAATPARRRGTVEEVADAVLYFVNATNFVTGQVLAVDGGLSQR